MSCTNEVVRRTISRGFGAVHSLHTKPVHEKNSFLGEPGCCKNLSIFYSHREAVVSKEQGYRFWKGNCLKFPFPKINSSCMLAFLQIKYWDLLHSEAVRKQREHIFPCCDRPNEIVHHSCRFSDFISIASYAGTSSSSLKGWDWHFLLRLFLYTNIDQFFGVLRPLWAQEISEMPFYFNLFQIFRDNKL